MTRASGPNPRIQLRSAQSLHTLSVIVSVPSEASWVCCDECQTRSLR